MVRLHMLNLRLGMWRNRRGTDLVTLDREQIRRDAERCASPDHHPLSADAKWLANTVLALLDALEQTERLRDDYRARLLECGRDFQREQRRAEQAERERDDQHHMRGLLADQSDALEARLAAVPALVEALEWIMDHGGELLGSNSRDRARFALAAYQETTK